VYRAYERVMDHWRAIGIPMLEIRYEELVREPEVHARRLIEFAGLPWDERCLRPQDSSRVVNTASMDQVRRPIYGTSVARWKRYERHLGGLIAALRV